MTDADYTLHGGRVIDPETGFDALADVAIANGKITRIARTLSAGQQVIDATGLIVAPGFIDLHAHGHSVPADRMQAFDGVTTTLELEVGVLPVAQWYETQANRSRVLNYGAASAWVAARQTVLSGAPLDGTGTIGRRVADTRWTADVATDVEVAQIVALTREGIEAGGLGIGVPNGYVPGSGVKEMVALCEMAADTGRPTYTHVAFTAVDDPRSAIEAYIRIIGYAAATGAHMHICHLNSSSGTDIEQAVRILRRAQDVGLPVSTEAYPYGTSSTVISAAFLTDPQYMKRIPKGYESIRLVRDGHRFSSREELVAAQQDDPGQLILTEFLDVDEDPEHSAMLDASVLYPGGLIASDAMPWITPEGTFYTGTDWPLPPETSAHPRSSGTFTRFLRLWARERQAVSWMEAIAKCTLYPAQILEKSTDQARTKGRLQAGMDADVVAFDPDTVSDMATFEDMTRPAQGMRHVFVNGTPVIRDGALDTTVAPGRPVRGAIR